MINLKGIIDRFEGDFAVVEFPDRQIKDLPKTLLPANAKAGDVIKLVNGIYQIDQGETERRKADIEKLADSLFE